MSPRAKRNRRLLLQRVALLACSYALPLGGFALFLTLTGINRQIAVTARERFGLEYLKVVSTLHDAAVGEIWAGVDGASGFAAELKRLEAWDQKYGAALYPTDRDLYTGKEEDLTVGQLRAAWSEADRLPGGSSEHEAAVIGLLGEVQALLSRASDSTGLTLSPDRETEYMTDIVAAAVPLHIERLLQVHDALAEGAAADRRAARQVAARLITRIMNGEATRLAEAVGLSLRSDARSSSVSAQFQREYRAPAAGYLESLRRFVAAVAADDPARAGAGTWEELCRSDYARTKAFWSLSLEELDALLTDQLRFLRVRRNTAFGIAAAILLTLLPLTWLYFRSYLRPLVQDMLDEVRENAEAAARAKNQFLAMMSHEIRTPMNGVIGFTNLLADTPLSGQQEEFVATIRSSGEALLTVINDILDYSKLEAGRTELESVPLVIRDLVEEVLDLLSVSAGAKKLELIYWIEPNVPDLILGDPVRLRQILVNLAGNAVKFTARGHVEIQVSAREDAAGRRVAFHVRDTGVGIPADRRERLFKPFSQIDSSVTRTHGGTGLGLAICRRLVDAMGGAIAVESEPEKGTDFHFEIPVRTDPALAAAAAIPVERIAAALRGRRVLAIDDYPVNRELYGRILSSFGAEAVLAAPEDALGLAASHPLDLVLVDYMMPGIDGISLAQRITEKLGAPHPPLVLATSVTLSTAALPPGLFAALVTKPIRNLKFAETLARALTADAPAGPVRSPERKRAAAFGLEHPLRLLVVDDNPVNLRVISMTLTGLGYAPAITDDAEIALERLRAESFDLVIMDVQMPKVDGLEATRRLRSGTCGQLNRNVRVLALTAGATSEERESCRDAGMDDFLAKPVVRAPLLEKLAAAYHSLPRNG